MQVAGRTDVGLIREHKGIDVLLRAFAEVSRKFPHARLVLKGHNPLYHSKEQLQKTLRKLPRVLLRRVPPCK